LSSSSSSTDNTSSTPCVRGSITHIHTTHPYINLYCILSSILYLCIYSSSLIFSLMSSFSFLVLLVCFSFLCLYVNGSATYQLYAVDRTCTTVSSSSTSVSTYGGTNSQGTFVQTNCFAISGVTGVQSGIINGAVGGGLTSSSFVLYSDACPSSGTPVNAVTTFLNAASNTGSGGCVVSAGGTGTQSAQWTISSNGSNKSRMEQISVILLLAVLVLFIM